MKTTTHQETRSYPLPAYGFRVSIDGHSLGFSKVSGLEVRKKALTYRHGWSFFQGQSIITFPARGFRPITLERGLIPGVDLLFLHRWLDRGDLRSMQIDLRDANGLPALTWAIGSAVPTRLEAPTFNAGANDVAVEVLEVQARGINLS